MTFFSRVSAAIALIIFSVCILTWRSHAETLQAHYLTDARGKQIQKAGRLGGGPVVLANSYRPKSNEMRGIWIATVQNLDFKQSKSANEFRTAYTDMLNRLQLAGFNTVFFQVRPQNDAFYKSSLNPCSRYFAGSEGFCFQNFDPLLFMLQETHRRGMKFHAWMNPYRVGMLRASMKMSVSSYLKTLAANNYARLHPDTVLSVPDKNGTALLLNPGSPEVRSFLANTVRELVDNYNVDGVVFDDYFYPDDMPVVVDYSSWRKYRTGAISQTDWRINNTERLILSVRAVISDCNRRQNRNVQFGISPFGIWANRSQTHPEGSLTSGDEALTRKFCDIRKWVKNGIIDYVSPQIYWGFTHTSAPYAALVDWWSNLVSGTNVKLYISHGVYRVGVNYDMISSSSLADQLLYNCVDNNVGGSIFYSYRHFFAGENTAMKASPKYIVEQFWKKSYLPQK